LAANVPTAQTVHVVAPVTTEEALTDAVENLPAAQFVQPDEPEFA